MPKASMAKAKKASQEKRTIKPYSTSRRLKQKDPFNQKAKGPLPPTIPFGPADRILLVGEGDFSFAYSLLEDHGCTTLTATSYDARAVVVSKYPQSASHLSILENEGECRVIFGVDATKLGSGIAGGGKCVKRGAFDKVIFNFPHVGGLTKDVNRQVRHNQELLVNFFKTATPLLGFGGSIVLTIFEGEPYELWNVRDLARHTALKLERSFRFQASAYPKYRHARTLGNIEGGRGWKGEDRPARTYIFRSNDGQASQTPDTRQKNEESDSD